MSIALWKTVLGLAKALSVVVILAAGLLLWSHRTAMAKTWTSPDFTPPVKPLRDVVSPVGNLSLALGRFQRERPKEEAPKEEKKVDDIVGEIAKYGEITDAIILYPPYEEGGLAPAIIFKLRVKPAGDTSDLRTIRLGEALVERPNLNPKLTQHPMPVKFKFVGCERDPENPACTYFLFDVDCDGKDIQKARWKFEELAKEPATVEGGPQEPAQVITDKMYVGDPLSAKAAEEPAPGQPEQVQAVPVPPVVPQPAPEPVTVEQEAGTLFENEDDVFAPTAKGVDYLERNYEKILEETRTATYRDGDGRTGVRIVGISNQSVANQFGIRKDDIIIKINGVPVASQSEAVDIVKRELKKRPAVNIIRVTIRRRGAEKELRFDTRDPATRRAAKKLR